MTDRAHSSDHPPHGTLAEEAAKLVEVAQQWLGERSAGAAGEGVAGESWADATAEAPAPECRGCPICRARRLLAQLDPEVFDHLSDALASIGEAMKAMGTDRDRAGPP